MDFRHIVTSVIRSQFIFAIYDMNKLRSPSFGYKVIFAQSVCVFGHFLRETRREKKQNPGYHSQSSSYLGIDRFYITSVVRSLLSQHEDDLTSEVHCNVYLFFHRIIPMHSLDVYHIQ